MQYNLMQRSNINVYSKLNRATVVPSNIIIVPVMSPYPMLYPSVSLKSTVSCGTTPILDLTKQKDYTRVMNSKATEEARELPQF